MLHITDNKEFIRYLGYQPVKRLCERQSSCAVYRAFIMNGNLKDYVVVKVPGGEIGSGILESI